MKIPEKSWHATEVEGRSWGQIIADTIANIAGSWTFFFVHVVWFTYWIAWSVEPYPYGLLTMIVSLEAIFLSTFILISQNRQGAVAHDLLFDLAGEHIHPTHDQHVVRATRDFSHATE